jgi:uncharacterized protein YmfQ (DUF2313 family)
MLVLHSIANYQRALRALMPQGRVWPDDPDTTQTQVLGILAPGYAGVEQAAHDLLIDAFPATAVGLLPEWEETLGLPDPCAGPAPSLGQRQQQVVARLARPGGQSISFLEGFALQLGYVITISQFEPAVMGVAMCGTPMYGEAWAYAWSVNAPETTVNYATIGHSAIGDPLATWGNTVLECEFEAVKPSHTTVLFTYG